MDLRRIGRWSASACVAVCVSLVSSAVAQERGGTVYRGVLTGGIWLELADDGSGKAELAVLDGLPGGAAETRFVGLAVDRSGGGCALQGSAGVRLDRCPDGGSTTVNVTLGQLTGQVILQPVGWENSIAWGRSAAWMGEARKTCTLTSLTRSPGLAGTPFVTALNTLTADAALLPASGDNSQALPRLRGERLRAYGLIALSPAEAEQAQRVADGVAGRPVLGRPVPLAEATRSKMDFDAQVVNSPVRTKARADLVQVDRSLAEIYDLQAAGRRAANVNRMRTLTGPGARSALIETLSGRQPSGVMDLVALEPAVADFDKCLTALGGATPADARSRVKASLAARAPDLVEAIRLATASSVGSAAARTALDKFEANPAVREALQTAGQGAVLADARGRITQMAQAEERAKAEQARLTAAAEAEARRLAAIEAARNAIPPTTRAPGGRFDPQRVSNAVVYIANRATNGSFRGSGFIVAPEIVVTNVHVVEKHVNVTVTMNGMHRSTALPAKVLAEYPLHDMAILRVPGLKGRTVSIASEEPAQGSGIWSLGFPGLADNFIVTNQEVIASLTDGIVSRVYSGQAIQGKGLGTTRLVQHTAETAGGNSGGPLFDACYRIVGIHTQALRESSSQFLVGISTTVLPDLLRQNGVTPNVSSGRCG